jgi:hypothetical protein
MVVAHEIPRLIMADVDYPGTTVATSPPDAERVRAADSQMQDPHSALERALIGEFLHRLGHSLPSVRRLPADEQLPLLRAAATYATLKLSEIESRARFVDEID